MDGEIWFKVPGRTTKLEFQHTLPQLSKETRIPKNKCRITANQTQPASEMFVTSLRKWNKVLWVGHDKQAFHPAIFSSILPFSRMTVHFFFLCIISLVIITRLPAFYNIFYVNGSHGAMRSFFQKQLITTTMTEILVHRFVTLQNCKWSLTLREVCILSLSFWSCDLKGIQASFSMIFCIKEIKKV